MITSFPRRAASNDAEYRYRTTTNRTALPTFTLVDAPAGATVDVDGVIRWQPAVTEPSEFTFTVRAELP